MAIFNHLKSFFIAYRQGLEMACPVCRVAERTAEAFERKRLQTAEVIDRKRKAIDQKIAETSSQYVAKARSLRERS